MNKFLTKQFLFFTLLATSLLAPAAYAQHQAALSTSLKHFTQESVDKQKRIDATPFIRTELFFGRNKSDGTEVTKKEFDDFLSGFITERFPDGLTVLKGKGQFLNSQGQVEKERSIVLILLYPVEVQKDKHFKIEEIRNEYKFRFKQQSVLRVDNPLPVWVSF
jgi:hypothetical protein